MENVVTSMCLYILLFIKFISFGWWTCKDLFIREYSQPHLGHWGKETTMNESKPPQDIFVLIERSVHYVSASAEVLAVTLDPQEASAWEVGGRRWGGRVALSERPLMSHMALELTCFAGNDDPYAIYRGGK